MTSHRICIVEDHPMMRDYLVQQVQRLLGSFDLAYSGASATAASDAIGIEPADCVILDLDLGEGTNLQDNLRAMVDTGSPVLIVSANATARLIQDAVAGGAQGYVSKNCEPDEFARALAAILGGQTYVSPSLAAMLAVPVRQDVKLSAQEQRALKLYASGMKLDAVARSMGVQSGTAKEYIRRVREKYALAGDPLPSKVDLFRKAQEEGLL